MVCQRKEGGATGRRRRRVGWSEETTLHSSQEACHRGQRSRSHVRLGLLLAAPKAHCHAESGKQQDAGSRRWCAGQGPRHFLAPHTDLIKSTRALGSLMDRSLSSSALSCGKGSKQARALLHSLACPHGLGCWLPRQARQAAGPPRHSRNLPHNRHTSCRVRPAGALRVGPTADKGRPGHWQQCIALRPRGPAARRRLSLCCGLRGWRTPLLACW